MNIVKDRINRILIIRLSSIGDVLHASPVANILRTHFPTAHIAWVVETKSAEVIQGNSNLDEVVIWPRKEWRAEAKKTKNLYRLLKRNRTFLHQLKKQKFDLVLDLQGMSRSALVSLHSGALYRACLSDAREMSSLFYNIEVKLGEPRSVQEKYASIMKCLDIDYTHMLQMEMPITPPDHLFADELLKQYNLAEGQFIIFVPSTSNALKSWPGQYFAKLGENIGEKFGCPIVILGGPGDTEISRTILVGMNCKGIDLTGLLTLKQVGALMKRCGLVVSGDTGPLYIAEAVGASTVSLFGPTKPEYYGPKGAGHISLRSDDHKTGSILPDQVFQAIEKIFCVPRQ